MTRRHKRLLKRMKQKIRKLPEYRVWMQLVFKASDRRCAVCGRNRRLQAHHIERFSKIVMNNNITSVNKAYHCKRLWDVSNGICLCQDCHQKLHSDRHFENLVLQLISIKESLLK